MGSAERHPGKVRPSRCRVQLHPRKHGKVPPPSKAREEAWEAQNGAPGKHKKVPWESSVSCPPLSAKDNNPTQQITSHICQRIIGELEPTKAMENSKVGGVFASRSLFTNARNDWSVGSFGDADKFIETRNSGKTVECKCKSCGTKKASPVNLSIAVCRKKVNGGITSKGAPVIVTDWNPRDCRMTKAGEKVSLPFLGQIFNARKDFRKHAHDCCVNDRKRIFERAEKGNTAGRKRVTDGCNGRVVVTLVHQKKPAGGHEWVPPRQLWKCSPASMDAKKWVDRKSSALSAARTHPRGSLFVSLGSATATLIVAVRV